MPTILTHPAVALAARALSGGTVTPRRLLVVAALCSALPDVDALGLLAGVPYGSLWGHRGLTHSVAFAAVVAAGALPFAGWLRATRWWTFGLVFLSTASHGLLDALTDDGLGVAFWSPFSNQRFFFPWRPIPAAPIGAFAVFSPTEAHVLGRELVVVWLPCLLVAIVAGLARRNRRPTAAGAEA